MKTNLVRIFAALSVIGPLAVLSSTATAAQPVDAPQVRAAGQNATTSRDHEAMAKHYEDVAAQVQAKLKEQKELLEQYQNKSYLYGRQAQDLQSHTEALIRDYEQTLAATIEEAATHRRMASKLQEKHASGTQQSNPVSGL